ncbi:hypothetical protein [Pyxidicoccus xibeiensis]|uniref:hypothetical protein n=1 Tax=Pyxidicoccus xibeiensis TaxID=2906759 RepID=UPI0020A726D7|nr:hypothetical protein [Pyxidicoccus xibeiensis]MCP3140999.1 hypothetical protein [Pyxidicoccus xibeiensis]
MSKLLKRVVASLLLPAGLLVSACGEGPEAPAEVQAPQTEVSPELFDLVARWSQETAPSEARRSAAAAAPVDLVSYVKQHAPQLAPEAQQLHQQLVRASATGSEERTAMAGCSCNVLAAISANPSVSTPESEGFRDMRAWPNRSDVKEEFQWNITAEGAAHAGSMYRYHYHGESGHSRDRQHYTRLRTQLACVDGAGLACSGSCSARMYPFVEYGTRVYAYGDTNGVWDKAAHTSVADGVVLEYTPPSGAAATQKLFDKLGAVSHFASQSAFNIEEVANLVKSALDIVAIIKTGDYTQISGDLISRIIRSFAGLVSRSGTNGSTSQDMYANFDAARVGAYTLEYSSSSAQVHTLELTSHIAVKNRGWGGKNTGTGRFSSSYVMAVAFDNFQCSTGVTPPARLGLWRYATIDGTPHPQATLQQLAQDFFRVAYGLSINAQGSSGQFTF